MRLAGKRCVITGAAQGIGAVVARGFAAGGGSVVLADVQAGAIAALAARPVDKPIFIGEIGPGGGQDLAVSDRGCGRPRRYYRVGWRYIGT